MIFIGVGYATMLIDAAGTYERTDGHTRTTQRIDCAQQLIRVVDRRGCVVRIGYRSYEAGCIVIDCRSCLRAGAVLRINDNSVRQGMRGVVVKVLYDLATAVGRAEYVPVKIVGAAGSNPGVVQIIPNTFCSQVAHDRRDIESLTIVTELHDARAESCLSRCIQDKRGRRTKHAFGIEVCGTRARALVVMRVVGGAEHGCTGRHAGGDTMAAARHESRIKPVEVDLLREVAVEVELEFFG